MSQLWMTWIDLQMVTQSIHQMYFYCLVIKMNFESRAYSLADSSRVLNGGPIEFSILFLYLHLRCSPELPHGCSRPLTYISTVQISYFYGCHTTTASPLT